MTQCNVAITHNLSHIFYCYQKIQGLQRLLIIQMQAGPTNQQILVHEVGQSVTWEILLNVTVILALLRHSWSAAFLHMVIGIGMFVLTYFFILWYLVPYGFIQSQKAVLVYYLHAIIGCAMLGFIFLIVSSGLFNKFAADSAFSKPLKKFVKRFHSTFAYSVIVLFKINILFNWYTTNLTTFAVLTAWDSIFFLAWIYLKFFNEKIQQVVVDIRARIAEEKCIPEATLKEIQALKHPYVIYNGHVYDATKVIAHHPGGQKVIASIIGREVDRFLYGMYSSELCPEVPPHSHSSGAFSLLRNPILKIATPCPFLNFDQEMQAVKIQFMNEVSKKSRIFILGLVAAAGQFKYQGYSDIRQLGQYYSLTMGESITRLYTAVNFLNRHNILLLNQLIPALRYDIDDKKRWRSKKSDLNELKELTSYTGNSNKEVKLVGEEEIQMKQYLPIMLKIYDQGKFTHRLEKMNLATVRLQLSRPKGLGLELDVTKPGKIVIVAGGTGLFPFSDLIDLLFKELYMEQNQQYRQEIIQATPVLQSSSFKQFSFVLLAAINDGEDLHPITHHQLAFLSKSPSRFKAILRVSKNEPLIKSVIDSRIEFTRDYFTERVTTEAGSENFSRVWICGPPKMSSEVAQCLLDSGFPRESFLLL